MTRLITFLMGVLLGFCIAVSWVQWHQDTQIAQLTEQVSQLRGEAQNYFYSQQIPVDPVIVDPSIAMDGYPEGSAVVSDASSLQLRQPESRLELHDRSEEPEE